MSFNIVKPSNLDDKILYIEFRNINKNNALSLLMLDELAAILSQKYLRNKSHLKEIDPIKFKELNDRFLLNSWRIIIFLCDYQMKYRYYSKAINAVKDKSYSDMNTDDFLKLFDKK